MKKPVIYIFFALFTCILASPAWGRNISSAELLFSLPEPWTVSQFNKAMVEKGIDKKLEIETLGTASDDNPTSQGKTVKNDAGKAYYLEVQTQDFGDEVYSILGLRNTQDEKQQVTFYNLGMTYVNASGSSAISSSANRINNVYAGTVKNKPVKIIEFDHIDYMRDLCKDYFFTDFDTGIVDREAQAKCVKTAYNMDYNRVLYIIDDTTKVVDSIILGTSSKSGCRSEDACIKSITKKLKGIQNVKEFSLTDKTKCTITKEDKTFTVSCD